MGVEIFPEILVKKSSAVLSKHAFQDFLLSLLHPEFIFGSDSELEFQNAT